ncbi:MAG: MerR family transcriptional regulator [Lachnospiraceae bacterium]
MGKETEDKKKMYSIGEAGKICNISTKTLRFYDKIGALKPDYVSDETGYRYYSDETLLKIPVIKYYKQMGFKLEEMISILNGESYQIMEDNFRKKLLELSRIEQQIHNSYKAVNDWYEMIEEAKLVSMQSVHPVSIKYQPAQELVYLDQEFDYDYRNSIINIPWTDYLDGMNCSITGPVMIEYSSYREKMAGVCRTSRIMQQIIGECDRRTNILASEGQMVASVYHVGGYDNIAESYQKILDYAEEQGFVCEEKSIERYVLDYWSSEILDEFVTEIMIPIRKIL